jgi:hypothetical protein
MLLLGAKVNELNHYVLYKLPELSHSSYIYVQHFHHAKQTSIQLIYPIPNWLIRFGFLNNHIYAQLIKNIYLPTSTNHARFNLQKLV